MEISSQAYVYDVFCVYSVNQCIPGESAGLCSVTSPCTYRGRHHVTLDHSERDSPQFPAMYMNFPNKLGGNTR